MDSSNDFKHILNGESVTVMEFLETSIITSTGAVEGERHYQDILSRWSKYFLKEVILTHKT